MKLSEAIRLGTTLAPPVYGPVFKRDLLGTVCGACRVGATALAAGYVPPRWRYPYNGDDWQEAVAYLESKWPWVQAVRHRYPSGLIVTLAVWHEAYKVPADAIAKHIERLEAEYDSSVTLDVTPNRAGDALQPQEVL